ncbi:MAG: CDP-alcohol phosphatidyltransferase family protein [Gammaproteobacteria bacterium]|nr:CDP-alcohol phosphatidyltransferase family protein [Gammaproteobacteria bacterium]
MMRPWAKAPNLLSASRLIAAPFLLYLAWTDRPNLFLALLALTLLSDAIDGFVARRLHVASELGTRLDSWGDLVTYLVIPVCAWWLWPEIIRREAGFVLLVLVAFIAPLIAGLLKFRRLTSYHTWSAKTVAVLMSVAIFFLFIADIAWPFRCAVILLCLSACEELAITLRLPRLRSNVRSYWHVAHQHPGVPAATREATNDRHSP